MVEFAGYRMPIQYEGIMASICGSAKTRLFDVSHMGQLLISGDKVAEALGGPRRYFGAEARAMRYSLLLADDGGILTTR